MYTIRPLKFEFLFSVYNTIQEPMNRKPVVTFYNDRRFYLLYQSLYFIDTHCISFEPVTFFVKLELIIFLFLKPCSSPLYDLNIADTA